MGFFDYTLLCRIFVGNTTTFYYLQLWSCSYWNCIETSANLRGHNVPNVEVYFHVVYHPELHKVVLRFVG